MEAAFANDMEPVADLLAPDAWVEAYGEDVGGIASVGGPESPQSHTGPPFEPAAFP